MTNTEIDRKLALAIGYAPEDITTTRFGTYVRRGVTGGHGYYIFCHDAPDVILPIMERYDCAAFKCGDEWASSILIKNKYAQEFHTNPRTAAALAVIEAKEMGLI